MKKVFWQDFGQYKGEIVVGVGCDVKDILSFVKKEKRDVGGWLLKAFEKLESMMQDKKDNSNGFCAWSDETLGSCVLWISEYDVKEWESIDVLIHELHHVVEMKSKWMGFEDEIENKAHLQEYLFRSIRRKLFDYMGKGEYRKKDKKKPAKKK